MRVGATALMLDLVEEQAVPLLQLRRPVQALKTVSRDLDLQQPLELTDGRTMRAIDIQRQYWEAAQRYRDRDDETDWVLDEWGAVLDLLETNLTRLRDRLDWVAKLALFAQVSGDTTIDWEDPAVVRLDLAYHMVDPGVSLYHMLTRAGRMQRIVTDVAIDRAETTAPAGTRATVRAACLAKFAPHITEMEWGSVTFQHNGTPFTLKLAELSGATVERQQALIEACETVGELYQVVQQGGGA